MKTIQLIAKRLTEIIIILFLLPPAHESLQANENCQVDTIILNSNIFILGDTLIMDIRYCGPACGCPEITRGYFWSGAVNASDSFSLEIVRLNDTNLRAGKCIHDVPREFYGNIFHLELNGVEYPDIRIAIVPDENFMLRSENLKGCANESGRLYITPVKKEYDLINVEWLQNDSIIKTSGYGDLYFPDWSESNKGTYKCVLKMGDIPFDTTNEVTIGFYDTQKPGKPVGDTLLCYMGKSLYYLAEGREEVTYEWKVEPPDAAIFSSDSSKVMINWAPEFSGKAKINVREFNGFCYGEYSDTLEVTVGEKTEPPASIYVTVNNSLNHNEIIWEYEVSPAILTFGIYRETSVSNQFSLIGTVLPGQELRFIDTKSNPQEQYYRYRISVFDTCGFESEPSVIHKTIHLTVNAGLNQTWNLIWDGYEGIDFSTYRILRGTSDNELTLLAEVAGTRSLYTDLYPLENTAYYQIEIVRELSAKKSSSSNIYIRSNIGSTTNTSIPNEPEGKQVQILMNYNTNSLRVININNPFNMEIFMINGLPVKKYQNVSPNQSIDLSGLTNGLYLIRINDGAKIYMRKFIF